MAGQVRVEFDVKSQKALQEFDKLNKKQQKAVVLGSKMGKEFEKIDKKASKAARNGKRSFSSMQNQIMSVVDPVNILSKAIQTVNERFEQQIKLAKKVTGVKQTFEGAVGNFISNNQQAVQKDPNLLKRVRQFSLTQGSQLGEGGAAQVLQALTDVRSRAGEGFTLKQQLSAVQKAVQGKLLDPNADIGSIASANLRVQKSLGVSERQAQNALIAFGPTAGGDVNAFVGEFGKLSGLTGATREVEKRQFGKSQTKLADILALEGITSQALGLSPEETTTIVQSVISKVGGARIGKKGIGFKSQNAVDRILELAERVLSGEFGTGSERQQVLTSAGLKGSQALPFLGALSQSKGQLASARKSIFEATTTGKDIQSESLRLTSGSAKAFQRTAGIKGAVESAAIRDNDLQRRIDEVRRIEAIEEATGRGGLGSFLLKKAIGSGLIDPEGGTSIAAGKGPQQSFFDFFLTKTDQQIKNQERLNEIMEEAREEAKKTNANFDTLFSELIQNKLVTPPANGQGEL